MTQKYWNNFYKKFIDRQPSQFAQYILPNIKPHSTLLDIGAGNGRDTEYLNYAAVTIPLDTAEEALKQIYWCNHKLCQEWKDYTNGKVDYVYSRFLLHSIPYEDHTQFIDFCIDTAIRQVFIECRAFEYGPQSYIYKGHKRWPVITEDIVRHLSLKSMNYNMSVGHGLAIYQSNGQKEDPLIMRLIIDCE